VEGIDPSRLPQRIALPPMPLELAAIADRLERLVGRVRETVAREKRFTGSAAHELRTPLAEIRALLDVRLKWPEDRAACLATMAEVRAINVRMEGLTSLLLQLARGEASRPATAPAEAVDATALLGDLLERHGEMGRRRGLRVSRPDGEAFWVRTDPAGLRSVLENLVINAMTHAPAGSAVEAGADLVGDRAELWIRNPAGRLTPDDLPRLFEPFWQKEEGRTPAHESVAHAGLGLAIARGIAARLGMELRADLRDGLLTFRVSIALPRLAPAFVDSGGPPSADVDVEPVPALPAAALAHPDD
jgi:signal transduction histidine kinase